ncbi:hypothetical protein VHEMI03674 [[Torrubiella] hemipterigena]|uniref:Uncharacterized protein n=1 Tax=[Torrubiella] hemipterigena TaxID=1531966 RepID=A0A0A1TC10_9HYPO|nr:hypothetical protein VHEMI03674 [[Torrubiella] hemipterigena]
MFEPGDQDRSNSLQQMLELERQAMIERICAKSAALETQVAQPTRPRLTHSSSAQVPTLRSKRSDVQASKLANRSAGDRRSIANPQFASLAIEVPSPKPATPSSPKEGSNILRARRHTAIVGTSPPSISYDATVPAAGSPGSPDKQSICHSPSWEAYDRHKKEKKEEKKRNKEVAKAQGRRTKRLSKPPPASSPYMFAQAQAMAAASEAYLSDAGRGRPQSSHSSSTGSRDGPRPRSRTGSFTNLLKSPFEFRRSSIDQSKAPAVGFVGGIKLEIERHEANQRTVEMRPRPEDTEVHPAFRRSCMAVEPTIAASKLEKDRSRRAYPPITRMPARARASTIAPSASTPDLNAIQRWRARAGSKDKTSDATISPVPSDAITRFASSDSLVPEVFNTRSLVKVVQDEAPEASKELARVSTPPPKPPRKSSKRNSALILERISISSVSSSSSASPCISPLSPVSANSNPRFSLPVSDIDSAIATLAANENQPFSRTSLAPPPAPSASPSWENLKSSVMNTIEAKVRPLAEIEHETWKADEWKTRHPPFPAASHGSSSDDSGSEAFFPGTSITTPNTSRPQSEKDLPRCAKSGDDTNTPTLRDDERFSCMVFSSNQIEAFHADPVQAAADNVMAAVFFPNLEKDRKQQAMELIQPPLQLRSKDTNVTSPVDECGRAVAKVFVECCSCKYYHDMPSKLYQAMLDPNAVLAAEDSAFAGSISMTVKCPWCKHDMKTECCAGYAAMVYRKKKLH